MDKQSIFEMIRENLDADGRLPPFFSLSREKPAPNELRFMPGAKDGISAHHMGAGHPEKVAAKIVKLLKGGRKVKGDTALIALLHPCGTLAVIDPVLDAIRKDLGAFDPNELANNACRFAFQSDDEELVKLGIALLGLVDLTGKQEILDDLMTLALYEEFTLYVAVAVSNRRDANDILLQIAKRIDGWGKISIVERLEPETEEIREWLLREGCENMIGDAYLGLECAEKGDLIGALRRDTLDAGLFDGISVIMDALLDEGPAVGISAYDHAEEALALYLRHAAKYAEKAIQLQRLLNAQRWLERATIGNKEELQKLCAAITGREAWRGMIRAILTNPDDGQFFHAARAAEQLGFDVSALILEAVLREPVRSSLYLSMVYPNPEYARQLTALYEKVLPLSEMATGMGDFHFAPSLSWEHGCLEQVLQELRNYPEMGQRLVEATLGSPVVRERNGACTVLKAWTERLGQPLKSVSPSLYAALNAVAVAEVDQGLKERMQNLLEGA